MSDFHVSACTDITGFGLLGHTYEMAEGSGMNIVLDHTKIPALPEALDMARMGVVPAGAYKNRKWIGPNVSIMEDVPLEYSDLLFDPQTSGGLLITVPEEESQELLRRLKDEIPAAEIIGYVSGPACPPVTVI